MVSTVHALMCCAAAVGGSMHRTARAMVTILLGLTAVLLPAVGLAADAGLTLTAETVTLGPHRTSVVLGGTYTCGPFASAVPTGA
jgi:hypothetical protein